MLQYQLLVNDSATETLYSFRTDNKPLNEKYLNEWYKKDTVPNEISRILEWLNIEVNWHIQSVLVYEIKYNPIWTGLFSNRSSSVGHNSFTLDRRKIEESHE